MKQELVMEEPAKFEIGDMLGIAMTFVVIVIGVSYGLSVTSDVQADFAVGSGEYNATGNGIAALGKFTSKLPLIATVVIAAIIIGILVRYLYMSYAK